MCCLQQEQAQAAALHGCHITALKTQLHAAMDPAGAPSAAFPPAGGDQGGTASTIFPSARGDQAGSTLPGSSAVGEQSSSAAGEGHQKTIAELRTAVEEKAKEVSEAATLIRALKDAKAKAER